MYFVAVIMIQHHSLPCQYYYSLFRYKMELCCTSCLSNADAEQCLGQSFDMGESP